MAYNEAFAYFVARCATRTLSVEFMSFSSQIVHEEHAVELLNLLVLK